MVFLGIQLALTPSVMGEGVVSTVSLFSCSQDPGDNTEPSACDLSMSPTSKTSPGLIYLLLWGQKVHEATEGRVTGVQVSEHLQI